MKRMLILIFALLIGMTFTAPAFSATFCDGSTANQTCTFASSVFGGGVYRPSAKVTIDVVGTTGLAYCSSSQHASSSTNQTAGRQFYTMSTSPQILYAPSATTPGPTSCANENQAPSGTWSN